MPHQRSGYTIFNNTKFELIKWCINIFVNIIFIKLLWIKNDVFHLIILNSNEKISKRCTKN